MVGRNEKSRITVMVYGDHISEYHPVINEPGVYLKSCVTVDSPNYLILYLDLSQAHSGTFDITFVNGEKKFVYAYELKDARRVQMIYKDMILRMCCI